MSTFSQAEIAPPAALKVADVMIEEDETDLSPKEPILAEDGLPILKTIPAVDEDMRAEALRVVADTVAQQRNAASRAIIYYPSTLAVWTLFLALIYKQFYTGDAWDWLKIGTTFMGVIMVTFGGIRMLCGPYIFEAERVGTWAWLKEGRSAEEQEQAGLRVLGDSDEVLLTKFGGEYIGAIIFRGVQPITSSSPPMNGKRSRRVQSPAKNSKLIIRAWSVAQKYRQKEIGSALLEDAIRIGMEKGWTNDGIEFAQDHANSKRVLPTMFNGPFDKFEKMAQRVLDSKIESLVNGQDKRRKR